MKAAPFDYVRPAGLDEACAILAADEGARLIAGGQTLVPLMAMRLARPTRLVDIARIGALTYIREEAGALAIGAATRQAIIEHDALVAAKVPLLSRVMPWIGHAPTRARGTIGGSLANADPAAESVLVAIALGAVLVYRDGAQTKEIAASEFFVGPMMNAMPQTACLAGVRFPIWREARIGTGFHEISARRSDFAFVSAAAQVALDADGRCLRLAAAIGAATDVPLRLAAVEAALAGRRFDEAIVRDIVRETMEKAATMSDLHVTPDYRRRVAATLAVRAIGDAFRAAQTQGAHAH